MNILQNVILAVISIIHQKQEITIDFIFYKITQ